MKLLLIAIMASLPLVSMSQSRVKLKATSRAGQNVVQVNQAWFEAFAHCDTLTLDRIVADDCIITTETGVVVSKAELKKLIQSMPSARCKPENPSNTEVRVQSFDRGAIVTGLLSVGPENEREMTRYTNAFVRRNGLWRLVAFQVTRVRIVQIKLEPIRPPK